MGKVTVYEVQEDRMMLAPGTDNVTPTTRNNPRAWLGYLFALVIEVVLVALLRLLQPILPLGEFPSSHVLAIMLIAYLFGAGPAVLAFFVGLVLFDFYFVPPLYTVVPHAETPMGWAALMSYIIGTSVVAGAMIAIRRSQWRIRHLVSDLEDEIEDRRKVEEELGASAQRFRGAIDGLVDPFGIGSPIRDESGRIVDFLIEYANRAGLEFLGTTAEEFIGGRLLEVLPDVRIIGLFDIYVQVAETGRPVVLDSAPFERTVRGERPGRTVDLSIVRVGNDVAVSWRDVTERVHAENALRQSEARFRSVLEASRDVIYRLDVQTGRFEYISPSAEAVMGYPVDELLAMDAETVMAMIHPDDLPAMRAAIAELEVSGRAEVEYRQRTKSGDYRWLSNHLSLTRDGAGLPLYRNGNIRDITEQKNAAEELARSREEMTRNYGLLQQALLPARPVSLPGFATASCYLPAAGEEIGGDFYDFFMTESGKIAVTIGDVTGKGIPSAALAAATRSTVHAFAYDISSPDEALSHANRALKETKEDPELFVTVLLVMLEPDGRICLASAGHLPPALYHAGTGKVSWLTGSGLPLGVLGQWTYQDSTAHMEVGDKLVLYTDGLEEARRGSEWFGQEGIERILIENGRRTPDDLVAALVKESIDWSGGHQEDDTAIVVIERMP